MKIYITKTILVLFVILAFFELDIKLEKKIEKDFFIDKQVLQSQLIIDDLQNNKRNDKGFHLFTHGKPGLLLIEGEWKTPERIVDWFNKKGNLKDKTSLYIYGCEFGKDEIGREAIALLEKKLKISVSASNNITGRNGDWTLEVGKKIALNISNYDYSLQCTSVITDEETIQAAFHQAMVKNNNTWYITGEDMGTNGTADVLSYTAISSANGYNYTGNIIKGSVASEGPGNTGQAVVLTDTGGIYFWGNEGSIINTALTPSTNFVLSNLTLPSGVTASMVNTFKATLGILAILLNDGRIFYIYSTTTTNTWTQANATPVVTFDMFDVAGGVFFARTTTGTIYTWGNQNTILANGTAAAARPNPTLMTLPSGLSGGIKQITTARSANGNLPNYFILDNAGFMFSVGENNSGQLGINSTTDQLSWQNVRNSTNIGNLTNIQYISATDNGYHDNVGVGAITNDLTLYLWGSNTSFDLIAGGGTNNILLPRLPDGISADDNIIFVENGAHVTPAINEFGWFGNVGHNLNGGFGDGTQNDRAEYVFSKMIFSFCPSRVFDLNDLDGDSIANEYDIDDENDGIVDAVESTDCFFQTEAEFGNYSSGFRGERISASTGLSRNLTADPYTIIDGITTTTNGIDTLANANIANIDIFRLTLGYPVMYSSLTLDANNNFFGTTTTVKLQGSVDGTTWTDLTTNTNVSGLTDVTFTIPVINQRIYYYYRLLGVAGSVVANRRLIEVTGTVVFVPSLYSKLSCSNNFDVDALYNHQDLDADNDGCLDAIEGGANIIYSQLVNAVGTASVGSGSSASNQNLCSSSACVSTSGTNIGLPQLLPLPTNYNNTTGQFIGTTLNTDTQTGNPCKCYKAPASGIGEPTNHGITALGRAGDDGDGNTANDWPMIRKGAWTVLEAKSKGFVINRIQTTTAVDNIQNPVNGMMVYDEEADCLKIYNGTSWKCFDRQTCPDVH